MAGKYRFAIALTVGVAYLNTKFIVVPHISIRYVIGDYVCGSRRIANIQPQRTRGLTPLPPIKFIGIIMRTIGVSIYCLIVGRHPQC